MTPKGNSGVSDLVLAPASNDPHHTKQAEGAWNEPRKSSIEACSRTMRVPCHLQLISENYLNVSSYTSACESKVECVPDAYEMFLPEAVLFRSLWDTSCTARVTILISFETPVNMISRHGLLRNKPASPLATHQTPDGLCTEQRRNVMIHGAWAGAGNHDRHSSRGTMLRLQGSSSPKGPMYGLAL